MEEMGMAYIDKIKERARQDKKTIVLPETTDKRTLIAAAKVVEEKAMGQRDLAYEINKYKTGYYFLFVVEAASEAIEEFNRVVGINENVIRHLVIKKED